MEDIVPSTIKPTATPSEPQWDRDERGRFVIDKDAIKATYQGTGRLIDLITSLVMGTAGIMFIIGVYQNHYKYQLLVLILSLIFLAACALNMYIFIRGCKLRPRIIILDDGIVYPAGMITLRKCLSHIRASARSKSSRNTTR